MITFSSLQIKGFKSIQDLDFDFSKQGLNVITGPNGAGKSTIFEAFFWCLFGKTLKNGNVDSVETKEDFKPQDYKGVMTILKFMNNDIEYIICRSLNSQYFFQGLKTGSKLIILENNVNISEGSHKNHLQDFIKDVLKVNEKTFLSCVLYGQSLKRLMASDSQTKFEIFNQFFELDFIDDLKRKADELRSQYRDKFQDLKVKIASEKQNWTNLRNAQFEQAQYLENFEIKRLEKINQLKNKINELNESVRENKDLILVYKNSSPDNLTYADRIKSLSEDLKLKTLEFNQSNSEINKLNQELIAIDYQAKAVTKNFQDFEQKIIKEKQNLERIKGLRAKPFDKCIYCNQVLNIEKQNLQAEDLELQETESERLIVTYQNKRSECITLQAEQTNKLSFIKKEKLKYDEALQKVVQETNSIEIELKKCEKADLVHQELKDKIQVLERQCDMFLERQEIYYHQLQEVTDEKPITVDKDYQTLLAESDKKIKKLESKTEQFESALKIFDFWVSKGFGSSGLKSYMINSMLNLLNQEVVKYSNQLNIQMKFNIVLEGQRRSFETKISRNNTELNYDDLSGGEKCRVDLSLAFGLFDVLAKLKQKFNILIFDEAFEGLDEEGNYMIMEMLRQKSISTNIFIITHNSSFDFYGCNKIFINKIDNVSQF